MTVIMYLTGLSQSRVVNTASQPSLRERMTAICSFAGSALALRRPILRAVRQLGGILPADAQLIQ